ncbi:PilW family protein [Planctomycetota bacterium]
MKIHTQSGFTLVELLIGLVASAIIALGAGTVLLGGHTSWRGSWDRVNLQRDTGLVLTYITHSIRPASTATVTHNGKTLTVSEPNVTSIFSFDDSQKNLTLQRGDTIQTLIAGDVESARFTLLEGGVVTIDLRLNEAGRKTQLVSSIKMRNITGGM